MKGSAIVQGLKSLASKLHPQLPLSSKESQRLLTALTSSFRKHLDEAHAPCGPSNAATPHVGIPRKGRLANEPMHSSAAVSTDKHLASVLTSPLLSESGQPKRPVLDYASATTELQKNGAKDPISLLEKYHAQGAANIDIAALCLEAFRDSLWDLTAVERKKSVAETKPATRVLVWLWDSKSFESEEFVESNRLRTEITTMALEEGIEETLWAWLSNDMKLGSTAPRKLNLAHNPYYPYRWKAFVLRDMVEAKLNEDRTNSANAALETFFRAFEMKNARDGPILDLMPACQRLCNVLARPPNLRRSADLTYFDRFVTCLTFEHAGLVAEWRAAKLEMYRPVGPTADRVLKLLKHITNPEVKHATKFREKILNQQKSTSAQVTQWNTMMQAVALLENGPRSGEADWVKRLALQSYPSLRSFMQRDLARIRDYLGYEQPINHNEDADSATTGLHIPSLG